jgi:hypothetical protein
MEAEDVGVNLGWRTADLMPEPAQKARNSDMPHGPCADAEIGGGGGDGKREKREKNEGSKGWKWRGATQNCLGVLCKKDDDIDFFLLRAEISILARVFMKQL